MVLPFMVVWCHVHKQGLAHTCRPLHVWTRPCTCMSACRTRNSPHPSPLAVTEKSKSVLVLVISESGRQLTPRPRVMTTESIISQSHSYHPKNDLTVRPRRNRGQLILCSDLARNSSERMWGASCCVRGTRSTGTDANKNPLRFAVENC